MVLLKRFDKSNILTLTFDSSKLGHQLFNQKICQKLGIPMIKRNSFNLQILVIPFLIFSASIVAFCYYLLQFIDLIVHGDLYGYGLVFSYEWANRYWNFTVLMRDSIFISILITAIATVFMFLQIIRTKNFLKPLISIIIGINIFLVAFSLFSLISLDVIVNISLYDYGLQFSYDWSDPYWNYLVIIFGLLISTIMINAITVLLLFDAESWFYKGLKSLFRINSLLFIFGVAVLYLSISFNSSVLAFVGLGLIFWGTILFFVRSSRYVKEELLLTATKSSLSSLRELILELGYEGKGIYLPPKYLRNFESSKVFISKASKIILPSTDQIQDKDNIIIKKPEGLLVTPPGFELSVLFEETLGVSFIQKDLPFIMLNLRRLIVEDLEIAQNVETEITGNVVHVRIENSVYKNMGTLSSAIACILAKTSGNLVIIEKRTTSKDGQIIDLNYHLYESPLL